MKNLRPGSLVYDYGETDSSCGYCRGKNSGDERSISYGMQAEVMSVEAYQKLLDRGWRRSGNWLYHPCHSKSCCQLMTIRLNVHKYQPNKQHRKVIRKWEAYLDGAPLKTSKTARNEIPCDHLSSSAALSIPGATKSEELVGGSPKRPFLETPTMEKMSQEGLGFNRKRHRVTNVSVSSSKASSMLFSPRSSSSSWRDVACTGLMRPPSISSHLTSIQLIQNHASVESVADSLEQCLNVLIKKKLLPEVSYPDPHVLPPSSKQKRFVAGNVYLTSPFPMMLAGTARKHAGMKMRAISAGDVTKLILDHLKLPNSLRCEACNGHLNFLVGKDVPPQPDQVMSPKIASGSPPLQPVPAPLIRHSARRYEVRTVRSNDPLLVDTEFNLFRKYQILHHGDEASKVTRKFFKRFLCESPLRPVGPEEYPRGRCPPCGFGSFHQQYWVDDCLVAVGVVDILPNSLSSKYLFWDPDLGALSLGKMTSMMEIDWIRTVSKTCPSLQYYYLGFYIHTCHRMKYKADFGPADLLCPQNYCWVPLERVSKSLDGANGMVILSEVAGSLDGLDEEYLVRDGKPVCPPSAPTDEDVGSVKLFINDFVEDGEMGGHLITCGHLCNIDGVLTADVKAQLRCRLREWISVVGPAWRDIAYHI